jgi:hypothetical protein
MSITVLGVAEGVTGFLVDPAQHLYYRRRIGDGKEKKQPAG